MRRRASVTGLACVLIAACFAAAPATASPVPCRGRAIARLRGNDLRETVRVRTFYIEAEPQSDGYKVGTTAKIDITVTRPAHEDPANQEVEFEPPTSVPAENVIVGIGVTVDQVFVPGFSRTDADGKATVSLKLPRYMKPGTAALTVYAWNVVHESPCLRVEEDGYRQYPEAFEVTR